MHGRSHNRKQRIVGRYDHRYDWIECPVTIKAQAGGRQTYRKREQRSDQ